MLLSVSIQPENWYTSVHELLRSAFVDYDLVFSQDDTADYFLKLSCNSEGSPLVFEGTILDKSGNILSGMHKVSELPLDTPERIKEISRLIRIFVFEWISDYLGNRFSEYGILSGVRPLKIVHRCLDEGMDNDRIVGYLQEHYCLAESKARFLLEVANNNHSLINTKEEAKKRIGIYVGIPYCPTKCYYCSFPGAVLRKYDRDIPPFIHALKQEIHRMGEYLKDSRYSIQNLYIGGGTPTVLNAEDMDELMGTLYEEFDLNQCSEFTVEAGRPDTIDEQKLRLFKKYNVDRICVNPQTMNDKTLKRIGRHHSSADVMETVRLAYSLGITNINMDLIAGLMGEGPEEYAYTLEKILELHPANVTVHSLAVKRGSILAEREGLTKVSGGALEIIGALKQIADTLHSAGYIPYYMYRQKYMKANLENTGYSVPGMQCLYNVQMMEERQTIIGLGGGASSKFVNPEDWTLKNFHNAKDPISYVENIDRYIDGKIQILKEMAEK